jgi:AraC family transcriptional regulator of adaptative response/methylated-DNA-[protein]-cysteine methyltransferase
MIAMFKGYTNMKSYATEQARWEALVRREQRADGAYVYGVVTTGVYCRPACSSKQPNRKNVRFFDAFEEAEQAGFRPCKRCHPQSSDGKGPHSEAVARVCEIIDESEEPPTLVDLASAVGLSPSYLHRLFKRMVGVTPKQYAMEKRLGHVRARLQSNVTVTEAIYEAGFASSSRFYEDITEKLGMKPSEYRNGGQGMRIHSAVTQSYLGWVMVATTAKGICAIDLADSPDVLRERLHARFPKARLVEDDPNFRALVSQVLAFLESPHAGLDLPLDVQGTAFQRRVWLALREIPPGSTASYGDIAARIGNPKAARAVASACASNPIAVAIPCHRVVRSDGNLGGYRWGKERKSKLLEQETQELRS